MIFVAVGTQKFQFNRLLRLIDELIENGEITEKVFAQIGNSTYRPKYYKYKKFLKKDEFAEFIFKADCIITHSGVATIIECLKMKKPIIVMPRLKKYGEHVDDHQMQIANSFQKLNYIFLCEENDNLLQLIKKIKYHHFENYTSQQKQIINVIKKYLEEI